MSLVVKVILRLAFILSLPAADKSFNSVLQLINGSSSDLQKLLKYFNDTAVAVFFRILLAWFGLGSASVFPNNLAL